MKKLTTSLILMFTAFTGAISGCIDEDEPAAEYSCSAMLWDGAYDAYDAQVLYYTFDALDSGEAQEMCYDEVAMYVDGDPDAEDMQRSCVCNDDGLFWDPMQGFIPLMF